MNKQVLEQINPETLLEAEMTKLRPSFLGPIVRRQGSLGKTVMMGKMEGSRET